MFFAAVWSPAGLDSIACDVFLCFVTFPYGVLGQVWYLILDICLLPYFNLTKHSQEQPRQASNYTMPMWIGSSVDVIHC